MDNSINFKGAFLLKEPPPTIRTAIVPLLGKGQRVYENVGKNNSVLYVVHDNIDPIILDFISQMRKVSFKYYPNLNLDNLQKLNKKGKEKIENVIEQYGRKVYTTVKDAQNYLLKVRGNCSSMKSMSIQDSLAKALGRENECIIEKGDNIFIIRDAKTKRVLGNASPPDKSGITYVSLEEGVKDYRYAAVRNGAVVVQYKDETASVFYENFDQAVAGAKTPKKPKKQK